MALTSTKKLKAQSSKLKAMRTKKLKTKSRGKKFSALSFELPAFSFYNESAFTLLEVLIVLFILGMIAVMAWPALGILDDRERESLTCERMEVIRRAIVGDPDRFDENGRRIIGGYVGDMEKWPDLWEAKAEVVPKDCESNCTCEDPTWDPFEFGFRPAGKFIEKRWKWCRPFRKVIDYTDHRDHIGGLETENEGQT
jgi:prepilin-type N-terminal cleavage/methylation domain-containing protein